MPPILDLFTPHLASKTTAAGGCRGRGARGGVKDGDHGSVCGLRAPGAGGWGRGMEGRALPMLINMGWVMVVVGVGQCVRLFRLPLPLG